MQDTPILLLDDATSALDVPTEAEVLRRLRAHTAGRVVLWAGHRPALRAEADVVVELEAAHV